jgi:hypothetical protein
MTKRDRIFVSVILTPALSILRLTIVVFNYSVRIFIRSILIVVKLAENCKVSRLTANHSKERRVKYLFDKKVKLLNYGEMCVPKLILIFGRSFTEA